MEYNYFWIGKESGLEFSSLNASQQDLFANKCFIL